MGPSFYGEIWFALQETMNFSYHIVSSIEVILFLLSNLIQTGSIDGYFGVEEEDGTFNGVVF